MISWWQGRSAREQILLGAMTALLLIVLIWLLILRPLASAKASATERQEAAVTTLAATQSRIATVKMLASQSPEPLGSPLPDFLRASALQAGFTNAVVDLADNDRARLAIPAAKGAALLAWLDRLNGRGVFIETANLKPNSDATLAFDATLRARGE
jgi:general secretion pathway protein M